MEYHSNPLWDAFTERIVRARIGPIPWLVDIPSPEYSQIIKRVITDPECCFNLTGNCWCRTSHIGINMLGTSPESLDRHIRQDEHIAVEMGANLFLLKQMMTDYRKLCRGHVRVYQLPELFMMSGLMTIIFNSLDDQDSWYSVEKAMREARGIMGTMRRRKQNNPDEPIPGLTDKDPITGKRKLLVQLRSTEWIRTLKSQMEKHGLRPSTNTCADPIFSSGG